MKKNKIILALETGIGGGSVSLIENRTELAGWIASSGVSGSEEILEEIRNILENSKIEITQIDKLIISEGPGSYTGLRIGLAIAKGLKTALGINLQGVNLLDEIIRRAPSDSLALLPFGKGELCWQLKKNKMNDENFLAPDSINFSRREDFAKVVDLYKPANLIISHKLYRELTANRQSGLRDVKVIYCNENYARIIGLSEKNIEADEKIQIIYPKRFGVG